MSKPESVRDDVYDIVKSEQEHNPFSTTDARYGGQSLMRESGLQTESGEEMYELGVDLGKTVLDLSGGDLGVMDSAYQSAKKHVKASESRFDDPAWTLGEPYTVDDAVGALEKARRDVRNEAEDLLLEYDWGDSVDDMAL